jgi:hypothetical protein
MSSSESSELTWPIDLTRRLVRRQRTAPASVHRVRIPISVAYGCPSSKKSRVESSRLADNPSPRFRQGCFICASPSPPSKCAQPLFGIRTLKIAAPHRGQLRTRARDSVPVRLEPVPTNAQESRTKVILPRLMRRVCPLLFTQRCAI